MEKSEGNRLKEQDDEDFQIRDPEIYQEEKVESDHLESIRQLQKNKVPTQNVQEQDFLKTTEKSDESRTEEEGQKQETDVKQKVERSTDNFLVRTQDSIPTIQLETVAVNQECVELAEDEMLELEKNIAVGTKTEDKEEILPDAAKDSIPAAEYDLNDAAQEEWDRIAKNEHLAANEALKQRKDLQRKLSTLCSKKEGLQQPCEVSVKVKEEQDIITQQEIETKHKLSETPTEARAAQYDSRDQELIQREKKMKKTLADFFNNQNQVKMQQRKDNLKEILFAPVQDKIPTAEHDSNAAAHEELDRPDKKERIETNAILQQRPYLLTDFFSQQNQINQPKAEIHHPKITHSIENSEDVQSQKPKQTTCRELEETGKALTQKQGQDFSECLSKSENGLLARSQEPKEDATMCHPETKEGKSSEIYPQNNAHSINNSEDLESQKPKQTITYNREWQEMREASRREHGEASFEEVFARSRDPKQNATAYHPEAKEGKKLECLKDFNLHRLEPDDIATHPQRMNDYLSALAWGSVRPQKTKDYVTFPFREPSETACSSKTKDYVTLQTRRSDNETVRTCRETIETARSSKSKDYVTLQTRRSDNETVRTCRETIETARSSKTKDYVTLRSRRLDNKTESTKISKDVSSSSKDYVTTHLIEQNRIPPDSQPPTHIFWPVQENASGLGPSTHMPTHPIEQNTTTPDPQPPTHIFWPVQENASGPGSSTNIPMPPLSWQDPTSTPKSNLHEPLGTQQLEGGEKASSPSRLCSPQDRTSPTHRRRRVPENGDVPPLPFTEDCPEVTVVTDEPGVQRNRTLSTGTRGFLQRIHAHFNPAESHTSSRRFSKDSGICRICFLLMIVFLIIVGIIVYYAISSNAASPSYNFNLNMDTSVIGVKNYHQNESLDGKMSIPTTPLDVTEIDFNIFPTPMADIDVNPDMDGEIIPLIQGLNDNVNTNEINSESNMATLVTNLDDKLINFEFGVTTPINDFDVNIITHVTDWQFNVINPVTYLDNVMNPVSCLENVITPVTDNNDINPITDVDNVINPITGLENDINPVTDVGSIKNPHSNLDISVINVTYSNLYNYLRGGFER